MAQAKTLSKAELKQLLDVTNSCSRYPTRDATMLLFTHLCGLRIGEVSLLRFDDILDANGNVRDEMTLDAARTKSKRARKIFLPKQMQRQLCEYVNSLNKQPLHGYLFSTQKQAHFSANTATQHLQRLYARAGIAGATSHSEGAPGLLHLVSEGLVCLC
jgi:integrase/recombinase XerD